MALTTWLSYFVGLWASIYLTDVVLRTHPYTKHWYQMVTSRLGLSFSLLHARLFTQRFNRAFHILGCVDIIPWKLWFSCGVLFSIGSMILSIGLLTLLVYNTFDHKSIKSGTLTPVMPGVNLPISHLGFYMLTLLFCALLHEAGHAIAALRERVRLHGFGLFLFGFYPGAYVDLNTADLQSLKPFSQLRIYCAGVWHNAVIALLSLVIFYSMPTLLSIGYHTGSGVGVTYLRENSVVTGHRGLSVGDAITQINSCPVTNQSDWFHCLEQAQAQPSGYCVSGSFLHSRDISSKGLRKTHVARRSLNAVVTKSQDNEVGVGNFLQPPSSNTLSKPEDCCAPELASTHLCFRYNIPSKYNFRTPNYACLPARPVTERATCYTQSDCGPGGLLRPMNNVDLDPSDSIALSRSMVCVVPNPPDNQTRLIRLVHDRKEAPAILFLGPLEDLLMSVGVSDYVSRYPPLLPASLPLLLSLFCTYLFSLSGALVILNVVPCYALDGQWILQSLIDLCLSGVLPCQHKRLRLFRSILVLGTLLLCTNVFLALWYLLLESNALNSLAPVFNRFSQNSPSPDVT